MRWNEHALARNDEVWIGVGLSTGLGPDSEAVGLDEYVAVTNRRSSSAFSMASACPKVSV